MPAETAPALSMHGIDRTFRSGKRLVPVLRGLDLKIGSGERVAVMGASGSGKSTLLHLAAGMDRPDAGQVELLGRDLGTLAEPQMTRFRARTVGLVFQDFNLIDSLSAGENIDLPLWLNGRPRKNEALDELTAALGIDELLDRLPEQLSGGEKQRVAIARALVHEPGLMLADEPTGSLDESTAADVLSLFEQITAQRGCALVLVTHNPAAAAICDRRLELRGGRLQEI
ncbi:ABC transporter ATP-binding protein [Wenzhouxiangella sp. XN201]|nr:ABC transporter ATP-binding protein [Wenzhouxiangella sp. XN201]